MAQPVLHISVHGVWARMEITTLSSERVLQVVLHTQWKCYLPKQIFYLKGGYDAYIICVLRPELRTKLSNNLNLECIFTNYDR